MATPTLTVEPPAAQPEVQDSESPPRLLNEAILFPSDHHESFSGLVQEKRNEFRFNIVQKLKARVSPPKEIGVDAKPLRTKTVDKRVQTEPKSNQKVRPTGTPEIKQKSKSKGKKDDKNTQTDLLSQLEEPSVDLPRTREVPEAATGNTFLKKTEPSFVPEVSRELTADHGDQKDHKDPKDHKDQKELRDHKGPHVVSVTHEKKQIKKREKPIEPVEPPVIVDPIASVSFDRKQRRKELLKNVEALKRELPDLVGKKEFPTASEKAADRPESPKPKKEAKGHPSSHALKSVHTPNGGKYILLPVNPPSKSDGLVPKESSRAPKIDTTSLENFTKNRNTAESEVPGERKDPPPVAGVQASQAPPPSKPKRARSRVKKSTAPAQPEEKSPFSDKQISPISFANSNRFSVESNLKSALDRLSINFSATKDPERDALRMQRRLDMSKVNWDLTPSSKHLEAKKILDEEISKLTSERQRKNSSKIKGGRPQIREPPLETVVAKPKTEYFNGIASTNLWDNQDSLGFKWLLQPNFVQVIKRASVPMRITCKGAGEGQVVCKTGPSSQQLSQAVLQAGDTIELPKGMYFGLENKGGEEVEFECVALK